MGKPMAQETKDKIGAANRGKVRSPETRRKYSLAKTGIRKSEETKAKISAALKGRKVANAKKVICIETGIIYESMSIVARDLGVEPSTVSRAVLAGKPVSGRNFTVISD